MSTLRMDSPICLGTLAKNEATVRSIAGGFGMELRVHNQGQHWELRRDGLILDWWPSTGRYMVNKVSRRERRLRTLVELRREIERAIKNPPAPLPPKKTKRYKDSGQEFVPDEALRCTDCGKPGAMRYSKKCGACSFGPMRFTS